MKQIIITLIALAITPAMASSFYVKCSSADQNTSWETGHFQNTLTVTARVYPKEGPRLYQKIEMDLRDMNMDRDSETIYEERLGGCQEGQSHAFWAHRSMEFVKVTITRRDGGIFENDILGMSKDRKSIKAEVLCEREISNQIRCN